MARLLARMLAALALGLPLASHGLGLGEITLRSALNQPLEAEIALLALRPDEVDSVAVKLASNAAFEQSGVERISLHSELRFKLQQTATGNYYIRAYTQTPIREPFLNFLVEVDWSAGRLVREYTVLLDPPTLMAAPAPRIQTPRTQSSSSTAARPIVSPTAAVEPERITRAQTSPAALPDSFTRPRDTLWSLAQRLRPDSSVSVQQMMLALLKANPDAFFEQNINSLKAGHHLRVPDLAEINTLSTQEAIHEVKQQNAAWSNSRSQPTASVPTTGPSSTARLKLLAAENDTAAKTVTTAKAGSDTLKNPGEDLSLTHETVEAKQQENEDLRSRLSELESQMEAMQKLLALKDENLANLQNKLEMIQPGVAAEPAQPTTPINTKELQTESVAIPKPLENGGFDIDKILHGLQDEFQNNLTLQIVAGGSALLLLALLWLIYRRRHVNATTTDIYDLHSPATGALSAKTIADDEFLDDIKTDAPEIKTVAKNSLAEVDVYLAYEQYLQAEVLLNQLIEAEPKRHELKLRLLELFYLTKNKTAFAIAAENLHTTLAGTGPLWKKAVDMGRSLYPEHPLFAHTTAPETPATDTIDPVVMAAPEVETPVTTDFTLDIPEIESPSPPSAPEYSPLDFEPPLQLSETTRDAAETSLEMANDEPSHADLTQDTETASDKPALELEVPITDEAPAPLEFSPDERAPETPGTTAAEPVSGNNELSFDMEDEAIAMAESDMTTQFDESEAETEEDSAQENSSDEVATKLDLARAYLDMGDEEGATSIIAEVLEEGNAAQKQEARDLMSNLTN